MGDVYASLTLLAGAIDSVQSFVTVFISVYTLMIFAYVILSWVRSPYTTHPVVRFLHDVCDPYLRLFRRVSAAARPGRPLADRGSDRPRRSWIRLVNGVLLENLK